MTAMACSQRCALLRAVPLLHQLAACGPQQLWPAQLGALGMSTQSLGAARFKDSFLSPPASLEADRGRVQYPPALEGSAFGRSLLRLLGAYSQKQQLAHGASILYVAATEASEDARLHEALGLSPDAFMSTHSLLVLHMWLIMQRLKHEDRRGSLVPPSPFRQALYSDNFYRDVERRVYREGVTVHVGKWLKRLEQLTYGSWVAYDTALTGERGQMVAALVRNVYGGDATMQPYAQLAAKYLNRELACLELTPLEAVYRGHVRFSLDVRTSGGG